MISFIVPTYNSEKTIKKCIDSILKQKGEKEIIIIDDGSTDNTTEILMKHFRGKIKYIKQTNQGPASARNRGIMNSKGKYIAFVDSDVELPSGWLEKAVCFLKKENIAGVGGPGISKTKNMISESINILLYGNMKTNEIFVDSIATMNSIYKKDIIKNIKFDTTFKSAGGEDPDFNFQIRERGYKLLFSPKLWVWHDHPTTLKGLLKKWYNYGKNYPRPFLKHRQMIRKGFYARMLYMPVFFALIILSFFNVFFSYIAALQIAALFVAYLVKGAGRVRTKILIPFAFIHTLKQLAQMMGIFVFILSKLNPAKSE